MNHLDFDCGGTQSILFVVWQNVRGAREQEEREDSDEKRKREALLDNDQK